MINTSTAHSERKLWMSCDQILSTQNSFLMKGRLIFVVHESVAGIDDRVQHVCNSLFRSRNWLASVHHLSVARQLKPVRRVDQLVEAKIFVAF